MLKTCAVGQHFEGLGVERRRIYFDVKRLHQRDAADSISMKGTDDGKIVEQRGRVGEAEVIVSVYKAQGCSERTQAILKRWSVIFTLISS
jgi:hypothetical protein